MCLGPEMVREMGKMAKTSKWDMNEGTDKDKMQTKFATKKWSVQPKTRFLV